MEAVARRAGVGKSALYRRWSSKQDMALAVLGELGAAAFTMPDTGSLYGDLEALMRSMAAWFNYPRIAPIMADLIAETTRDPGLGDAVQTMIRAPRQAQAQAQAQVIFDHAIARGEMRPTIDPEVVLELIPSMIYWRNIVRAQTISDDYIPNLITTIAHGLTPTENRQRS